MMMMPISKIGRAGDFKGFMFHDVTRKCFVLDGISVGCWFWVVVNSLRGSIALFERWLQCLCFLRIQTIYGYEKAGRDTSYLELYLITLKL